MAKKYALDLDNGHAGWVTAPGDGFFDVTPWLKDRQGAVLLHPEPAFWGWFEDSVYGDRREATIVAFDAEGRESERLVLTGALITEIGLPALAVNQESSGQLRLEVELKAGEMRAGGETTASARGEGSTIAGCRLLLHGPEAPPLRVNKIEALAITPGRRGLQRMVMTVEGEVDRGAAEALIDRTAALEYLAADETTVLTRVEFRIAGIDVEALAASTEGTPQARLMLAGRGVKIVLAAKAGT